MARKPRRNGSPHKPHTARPHTVKPRILTVRHLDQPPRFIKPKRVHPRRVLPFIREGIEREFHSMTEQVVFHRPLLMAAAAPLGPLASATGELALAISTELTSPGSQQTASNVGEPSVAANGDVVFYTGNWYAAMSSDGGRTFRFLDPATAFKSSDPPNSSFCCDQIVHYIASIDTFVWLLQYGNSEEKDNIQRLAFAKSADVVQGRWRLFDITTNSLGTPGVFLDFPDLAIGANCLYVTTNIFAPGNQAGSAVVRIPLAGIANRQVIAQS